MLEERYVALRRPTIQTISARLWVRGLHRDAADLDGAYHEAWCAVLARLERAEPITNLGALLTVVAYRRAIDDLRRARPGQRVPLETVPERVDDEDARIDELEARRRLREFAEGLRDELPGRALAAAELCYLHGHSRAEAAHALGLSDTRMKKVMDSASKRARRLAEEIDGGTRCAAHASRNHAFALGVLRHDGPRHGAARRHLRHCPACREDVRRIREDAGRAAKPTPGLEPGTPSLRVKCSTS